MKVLTTPLPLLRVEADLIAIGVGGADWAQRLSALDNDWGPQLATAARHAEFKADAGAALSWPTFGKAQAPTIVIVGAGERSEDELRRAAGKVGSLARAAGATTVAIDLGELNEAEGQAVVEGLAAGNYKFDKYKSETERKAACAVFLMVGDSDAAGATDALAIAAGQDLARDLVNEPPAVIYPESLAAAAAALADDRLTVDVWDLARIRAAGMGGIIAVGQGSDREARLIHMHYKPAGRPRRKLALVGKGVTFDSGGLSIKTAAGMLTMRCDMAGGAAIIGVMRALRDLRPDVEVHGIIGAVENMLNGNSYKVGDILRMYNGKTVEVHNTDAEGRLVLGDCLALACEQRVDAVVDIATLTGACVVALGDGYSGLFTKSDDLAGALLGQAAAAGEGLWRMPLPDLYKDKIKADWGGIKNVGGREAGAITAALFLSEFVDATPWAHIDIAGPAFFEKPVRHMASGGTGAMVATLTRWVTR